MTKLSPRLPMGDANGLDAIGAKLVENPDAKHLVLAIVDTVKVVLDSDTGNSEATARIRRVEVLLPGDANLAHDLMARALEARTGKAVLPFTLQQELQDLFAGIDPTTGEVLGGASVADPDEEGDDL